MLSSVEIVKSATVVIAMIVAFACLGQAEERRRILPDQIVAILSRDFPGWVLIDNSEVIRQPVLSHLKLDTTQSQPNLVWGDFNGDGRQDYATFLTRETGSGREQLLVAFVSHGTSFKTHLIEKAIEPAYIADYIWLARKGNRYYDHSKNRYFRLAHDAIDAVIIEKAAVTYVYDRGTFRAITTAD